MTWSVADGGITLVEKSVICPRRLVWPASWEWLDLYRHSENGVLPLAGGLVDQPYSYHRAMALIADWKVRCGRSESKAAADG